MTGPKQPRSRSQSLHPAHVSALARATAPDSSRNSNATTVSPALYQRVVAELEQAHQQISQLTIEKQQLEATNVQLQQQVDTVRSDLQSGLNRLAQLAARSSDVQKGAKNPIPTALLDSKEQAPEELASEDRGMTAGPSLNPPVQVSEANVKPLSTGLTSAESNYGSGSRVGSSSYDFLERLKQRRQESMPQQLKAYQPLISEAASAPIEPESYGLETPEELEADSSAASSDLDTLQPSPTKSNPRPRSRRRSGYRTSRSRRPKSAGSRSRSDAVEASQLVSYPSSYDEDLVEDLGADFAQYSDAYQEAGEPAEFPSVASRVVRWSIWILLTGVLAVTAFGASFFLIRSVMPTASPDNNQPATN